MGINNLVSWADSNKMFLNASKCHVIFFSYYIRSVPQLFINGSILSEVHQLKLLGVIFCSNLSLIPHGNLIISMCYKSMAILRKMKNSGFSGETIWMTYLALVFSRICYCWPAICDMPKSIIHAYVKFEKQAHRLSNKLYFYYNY